MKGTLLDIYGTTVG